MEAAGEARRPLIISGFVVNYRCRASRRIMDKITR